MQRLTLKARPSVSVHELITTNLDRESASGVNESLNQSLVDRLERRGRLLVAHGVAAHLVSTMFLGLSRRFAANPLRVFNVEKSFYCGLHAASPCFAVVKSARNPSAPSLPLTKRQARPTIASRVSKELFELLLKARSRAKDACRAQCGPIGWFVVLAVRPNQLGWTA